MMLLLSILTIKNGCRYYGQKQQWGLVFLHVLVMRREVNEFSYSMINFYLNSLMSIGMIRKKAVSDESRVIRDSDSSEKGIIHIAICLHFNN